MKIEKSLISEIKTILTAARSKAYAAVNFAMIEAYWQIGKRIVQEEQKGVHRAKYGTALIKELSKTLTIELGKGFSEVNLKAFRKFYITFSITEKSYVSYNESPAVIGQTMSAEFGKTDISKGHASSAQTAGKKKKRQTVSAKSSTKVQTGENQQALSAKFTNSEHDAIPILLRRELTWSHYQLIMRVENENARQYYIQETADNNWSVRTLQRNINTFYYERLLSSQNKKEMLQQAERLERQSPADFIKDPYIFEFLNISEPHEINEHEIEAALIDNLQSFLLELGKGFCFVKRQLRITTETKSFAIDLVFYNYILKCFVLFDLKTGELSHQDVGQMDMYVRIFDDQQRPPNDNPTIGIILCTHKDETIVRYSVLNGSEQLFATKYRLYLPTEEELIAEIEREKLLIEEKLRTQNQK